MKARNIRAAMCVFAFAVVLTTGAVSSNATQAAEETAEMVSDFESTGLVYGAAGILSTAAAEAEEAAAEAEAAAKAAQEAAEAEEAAKEEEESISKLGVAEVSSYLKVRDEASKSGDVVGILYDGSVAEVEGEEDGWYKITSGSISGYVSSEYLTVGDSDLLESVKTTVAVAQVNKLRVREEASTSSSVITKLSEGDSLEVIDQDTDGWVKVCTADGEEGYVSAEYVEVTQGYVTAVEASSDTSSSTGSSVANYALQFVGNPYVWGGSSLTNGTDCSGFIMSVYAHFGVSLPHSSYALRSVGTKVSYSEAQPGDIICYSGHVALYIGNGQIVHASNKRDGIKISSATYKSIITVRRIFN